ncbi:MAG: protein kinase, partial [Planctomycetes bacterium]|nr:protein kinase [Planctomycetota bacterium]
MNDVGSQPPRQNPPRDGGENLLDLDPALADAVNPAPAATEGATLFSVPATAPAQNPALNTLLAIGPGDDAAPAATPPAPLPATESRYEILREHARGGMGRVLLARDNAVGREVALKELLPGRQGTSGATRKTGTLAQAERFLREARVTGQLEHPGIVPVYEIGQRPDGAPFYTMKFVRGRTLADRLREIRDGEGSNADKLLRRLQLLDPFTTVCEAVAFAHSRGVIHRDLKPQNMMIGDWGETLVLDWGLARVKSANESTSNLPPLPRIEPASHGSAVLRPSGIGTGASVPPVTGSAAPTAASAITLDGAVIGTPAYMSPEQAAGNISEVDEQSDVYSLGAILYEIMTGLPPYEGSSPESVVKKVLRGPPSPVLTREPGAPPELAALVERAMERDRARRLRAASELVEQVRAFRQGRTLSVYQYSALELVRRFVARHKAATLTALLAVAALVASGVWYLLQINEQKRNAEQARQLAEQQRFEAETQRAEAMSQRERAMALSDSERTARQESERQRAEAERQRQDAERQRQLADQQRALAVDALAAAEARLADAYAMRARIALDEGRYNEALSFAAQSLLHGEQAEARGILIATPGAHPLLQRLVPRFTQQSKFEEIYGVAVSPNGRLVATGISEGSVWIWDTVTGREVATLPAMAASAMCVAFHPDGETLAAGYADGSIRLWSLSTFTLVAQTLAHEPAANLGPRRVLSLEFSPDGSLLASGATFGHLRVSRARNLELVSQWAIDVAAWMQVVSWSRDQKRIAAASSDNLIRVVDVSSGEIVQRLSAHEGIAYSCDYSPDGKYLASGSWDTTVRLWDHDGNLLDTLRGHSSIVLTVRFSPDGKYLASGSADGTVALWSTAQRKRLSVIPGQGAWVHSVAFTPDSSALAVRTVEGTVTLWALGHSNTRQLTGHSKELFDVRFSPDGTELLTCSWDGTTVLWDAATLAPLRTFRGHIGWIMSCTFSPDGTEIATSGFDGTVRLWDKGTGREKRVLIGVVGTPIVHVCFSPDSRLLAGSSVDNTVRLWKRDNGSVHAILRGHDNPIAELSFSPDGTRLASVSADKTARVWDVEKLVQLEVLRGHEDAVATCDFSADGRLLATGSIDRTIRVWDTANWQCVRVLQGHTEGVHNVRFARDSKHL